MQKIIKQILKKNIKYIIFILIFIMINMYVLTLPSKIIGHIIDLMVDVSANKAEITKYLIVLILSVMMYLITRLPWRSVSSFISRSFEKDMKDKIFEQFLKIKMNDLENIKNGELMSYMTKDVGNIRSCLYNFTSKGIRIIATSIIVLTTMIISVDFKLTIMTVIPILITTFVIVKIKEYVGRSYKKSQKYFTELSEYVQESTDSIRTIKAYSGEIEQFNGFIKINKLLKGSNNSVDIHSTLLDICTKIGFGLCYGIAILYGSNLVLSGKISIGDFTAFNGYIGILYSPVTWIPSIINKYKRAKISYKRLDKFCKLEIEKIDIIEKEQVEKLSGDIIINNLTYNYPSTIEGVLKDINLTIKQGETLGIIGTIGSGKTTLMNLLLRLYQVKEGKINIGGKDINQIPLEVLRKNICYITQDNFLFSTTLKENISLFKEEYEDKDIEKSTQKAMLKEDISNMKNGIETVIGERGIDLSGGQKQRVVISRAFLQNSNFVIFDDTFSALDNKTEERLLENVKEMTKGKTCIIISNRISDIKDADNIIVLDEGRIIQQGNHEKLVNQEGLYHKFYIQQSSKEEIF